MARKTQEEILRDRKKFMSPSAKAERALRALGALGRAGGRFYATRPGGGIGGAGKTRLERVGSAIAEPGKLAGKWYAGGADTGRTRAQRIVGAEGTAPGRMAPVGGTPRKFFAQEAKAALGDLAAAPQANEVNIPQTALGDYRTRRMERDVFGAPPRRRILRDRFGGQSRWTGVGAPNAPFTTFETVRGQFPNARTNAAAYGLRRSDEYTPEGDVRNVNRTLTRLMAQKSRTRDTQKRRDIQSQIDDLRGQRTAERGERMAQARVEGDVMQAAMGNQAEMAKIQAGLAGATATARYKALGDALAALEGNEMIQRKPEEEGGVSEYEQARENIIETFLGSPVEAPATEETVEAGLEGDIDGDGRLSADEKEYNRLSRLIKDRGDAMSPADLARAKKRQKELSTELGLS